MKSHFDEPRKSVAQLAKMWAVDRQTVYTWIREKKLVAGKIGNAVRIRQSDWVAFEKWSEQEKELTSTHASTNDKTGVTTASNSSTKTDELNSFRQAQKMKRTLSIS